MNKKHKGEDELAYDIQKLTIDSASDYSKSRGLFHSRSAF